jgi:endonuclease/exonuclease/phosphatase (EEP) superfamily protein YafD
MIQFLLFFILILILATILKLLSKRTVTGGSEKIPIELALQSWSKFNKPTKPTEPTHPSKNKISILTWNVHMGKDATMANTELEMIKFIDLHNPDILCLQEFPHTGPLRDHLFEKYSILNKCETPEDINNVIFASDRFTDPISTCYKISDRRVCARTILTDQTKPKNRKTKKYSIYNVHHEVRDPSERLKELDQLANLMEDDSNPKILLGDFNAPKTEADFHKQITQAGFKTQTFPQTSLWGKQVDFIYSKGLKIKQHVLSTTLSDHLPIIGYF